MRMSNSRRGPRKSTRYRFSSLRQFHDKSQAALGQALPAQAAFQAADDLLAASQLLPGDGFLSLAKRFEQPLNIFRGQAPALGGDPKVYPLRGMARSNG